MARRRYLTTDVSLDERVNDLAVEHGDFAALLYTWMIPHAEDDGTIHATPRKLLYMVVPMRRDKTEDDISAALRGMVRLGLIEWKVGAQTIAFPAEAFYRYQTYIKADRRRDSPQPSIDNSAPDQPTDEQRNTATGSDEQRATATIAAKHRKTPQKAASHSHSHSHSLTGAENGAANDPWALVEELFEIVGADATQLGSRDRGKQAAAAKALLADHERTDVLSCARWLQSQDWWRQRGIDVLTVREHMARWSAAGRPEALVTSRASPATPVALGAAYKEFSLEDLP